MEFSYQIFIFFLGFLSAAVAIALFYFFFNNKKKFENNQHEDLGSIKENISGTSSSLESYSARISLESLGNAEAKSTNTLSISM